MSIRLRVTLATVAIAALAVGAADIATFTLLRGYFNSGADASVRQVAQTAVAALQSGDTLTISTFARTDRPVLVEVLGTHGKVLERVGTSQASVVRLPSGLLSHPGRSRAIGAPNHEGPAFQVIAVPAGTETVVAAVSLTTQVNTLAHLFRLNFIVGTIVLVLLAAVAAMVLTRSLRPLRRIAATADAIVAGDLGARVPQTPRRSEIARVAVALNRMLSENEAAFAQRDATESRLRQFLADVSHELRTPLTSIRGYAELFRRGADARPDDLAVVMRAIEDEAVRMSRLVDDLLLLAQLDDSRPLERHPFALDDVVEAAVEAARAVEPERPIGFELSERPVLVEGDEGRLRQVVDNLLANVRRHTPAGSAAYVSLEVSDGHAVLDVADSGPGVPESDREFVFDRFFRPDASRGSQLGGAGLGLAIVRSIVTAHRGQVSVRPARPHGAVFEIRLPLDGATLAGEANSRATLS